MKQHAIVLVPKFPRGYHGDTTGYSLRFIVQYFRINTNFVRSICSTIRILFKPFLISKTLTNGFRSMKKLEKQLYDE